MRNNIIFRSIQEIKGVLPRKFKVKAIKTYGLIFLNSILDLVGLAAILPFVALILQDDFLEKYHILNKVYNILGFTSHGSFIVCIAVVVLIGIVLKNIIGILINREQARFSVAVYKYLTGQVLQAKLRKGFLYFTSTNSNKILRDIVLVPKNFSQKLLFPLLNLFNELTILTLVVISLVVYDPRIILLLSGLILPFFIIFYRVTRKKIQEIGQKVNDLKPQLDKPIFEMIFGYADTQVTGTEELFKNRYRRTVGQMAGYTVWQSVLNVTPVRIVEVAIILAVLVMMLYGYFYIDSKESTIALLGVFGLAAYRTVPTMNRIMSALMLIKSQQYSLGILKEVDNYMKKQLKFNENLSPLSFMNTIEFDNIQFAFPNTESLVLKNISFEVKKGESVGLIGQSGSGKTTLISILLQFLQQQNGRILIDGVTLTPERRAVWQQKIGYVRQDVFLIDGSMAENIAFGVSQEHIDYEKVEAVVKRASLTDVVSKLEKGVDTPIGERGAQLSGGQRQRVGIARALYYGAEILVFDEATSALDTQTEVEITEAIKTLSDKNLTMFIIAHRTSTLKYCDKIIELEKGELKRECLFEEI